MTDNDGTQERAAQTMPGRDELRERLEVTVEPWLWVYHPDKLANAILVEIERAGYVLVKADRWERVQKWAAVGDSFQHELWLRDDPEWIPAELQPGDLDGEEGA